MKVNCTLRFSSVTKYTDKKTGEEKYLLKMLDNDDESYMFFLKPEKAQKFLNAKHYQEFDVSLSFYKDREKGNFVLFLNV